MGQFTRKAEGLFGNDILTGPNGQIVAAALKVMTELGGELDKLFGQALRAVEDHRGRFSELSGRLQRAHDQQELAFRDLIARHNQAKGIATERAQWEQKRNDLLAKQRRHADVQQRLRELRRRREELTDQLKELWNQRFAVRQEVSAWINQQVSSPIRVRMDQFGDVMAYQGLLAGWLRGTVAQYNVVARRIAQYVPPLELARIVAEERTDKLQQQAELTDSQAPKAMEALRRLEVQFQLDIAELADLPSIELKDGDEWKNSLRLSTGQKCTTILPILLLDSDNPLLVDQPEDNLDNRFIYDTVVDAIVRVKQRRQIVLITHNPNIPVLGEASEVYVLTSDGERASLANTGTVDDCKTEIINLLEGGREAFLRRKERYNY